MADPYVRELGTVEDIDGIPLRVGVDYDSVSIGNALVTVRLTAGQCNEFAALFVSACQQAGQQSAQMRADADG